MHSLTFLIRATSAVFVLAGAVAASAGPAQAQGRCGDQIIAALGDTLEQVARRCGVPLDALRQANPLQANTPILLPGLPVRIPVVAPPPPPPPPVDVIQYSVRPGDTLSAIARAHGVAMADLFRLNPDLDARTMRVGDVILIQGGIVPPPPLLPPPLPDTVLYTVRRGDTLGSIARANGTTRARLRELNPGLNPANLRSGDVLLIPAGALPPPPAPEANLYTVRPGDTFGSIARAHGTTRARLRELNPGFDPANMQIGDVLRLPTAAPPPPPPPVVAAAVSISPASGPPGTLVKVTAAGFAASARLRLLAGLTVSNLRELQQVTADGAGGANLTVRVPDWAAAAPGLVFAYETTDGRLRSVSEQFRIVAPAPPQTGRITVVGTLTREGTECQAMRGDDGVLYTLAGSFAGFQPGDRVRVQGRRAQVSTCQQGTTIDVSRIEDAP